MNNLEINIKVTEKQAQIIEAALEFYMRWCIGQMRHIPGVLEGRFLDKNPDMTFEDLEITLNEVKKLLFPEHSRNSSFGVGWNEKPEQQHAQIAYEIWVCIKACFGQSRYDTPLHYSQESLPIVEKIAGRPA